MSARARRPLAWVAALAVATGACTTATPTPSPSAGPIGPDLSRAPIEVTTRVALPFCGFEVGHPPEGFNVAARQCFVAAASAGRPAEFISTRPTAGGAPITAIWRSLGGGRIEFFVDLTRSGIAGGGWTRTTCPQLTLTNDPHVAPDWIPGTPAGGCIEQRLGNLP